MCDACGRAGTSHISAHKAHLLSGGKDHSSSPGAKPAEAQTTEER